MSATLLNARAKYRIGVLVPYTNTNLEPDLQMMAPSGVNFHFARIGGYSEECVPDADEMVRMGDAGIDEPLKLIAGCKPDAVLYGCTSATLAHGCDFDIELAAKIKAATGAKAFTAAGSIIFALNALRAMKVALATPYVGEINDRTVRFLASEGIETVACARLEGRLLSREQGAITPQQVYELALRADHKDADAIVLACTDLRAVEAISLIEAALNKPVISSNQAMFFAISNRLGLGESSNAPGYLFHAGEPTT